MDICQLNYYSCAVDCWSLGCVISEMYLNSPIFNGNNTKDQLRLISKVLGPMPPSNKYPQPKYMKNLAEYKLSNDQWMRKLKHRGGKNKVSMEACDFIRNLLCYVPDQRFNLGTLKCLNHPFINIFLPNNKSKIADKYPKVKLMIDEMELI